ncbi:Oleoyl-(acyl-carrier-protein) hydrolase [Actinobacteria bacterium OK074]|nr:Oleoyl-(acyl-carrier-protein) hydrolase [Actinobacteria bacterium OK074]
MDRLGPGRTAFEDRFALAPRPQLDMLPAEPAGDRPRTGESLRAATRKPGPWAVRWHPAPQARLRLFCLPHAGGGAAVYQQWARRLAPAVEVVAIRLPGRESRLDEPPLRRVPDIVAALTADVGPWLDRPHAWFGHSLGALIAFEMCRALDRAGLPAPVGLLVSGRPAAHLTVPERPVHRAPLPEFLDRLRELNGTPPEILADRTALAALLPMLRADFTAVETYAYQPAPPLNCPISAFGGFDDPFAARSDLDAWRVHTNGRCTVRMFGGDHFYLHRSPEPVLSVVADDLRALSDGPRRSS